MRNRKIFISTFVICFSRKNTISQTTYTSFGVETPKLTSQETKMFSANERNTSSPSMDDKRDGCTSPMSPSNYMKASVQFPPYKSDRSSNKIVTYDVWRNRASKSPIERITSDSEDINPAMFSRDVKTKFEHVVPDKLGNSGTKTVTRTITPTGELTVYASQSSVRFKMTANKKEDGITPMTLPRPTFEKPKPASGRRSGTTSPDGRKAPTFRNYLHDTDMYDNKPNIMSDSGNEAEEVKDNCRDLYPVTSVKRFSSPARSISLKETSTYQPRFPQTNPTYSPSPSYSSPSYNIVHRDSPNMERDSGNDTPQQGHLVVVAIDFGTTYSGYAYSFASDPENISIMRKWEGKL